MQSFLAIGCVVALAAALTFYRLWRGALAARATVLAQHADATNQLRQSRALHGQATAELTRRRQADEAAAQKRSAAVSKGNRNRAKKVA